MIALMRRAGVSDARLAVATDATVQAVGQWKRKGNIARQRIPSICRVLRCSSDELLGLAPLAGVAESPAAYASDVDRTMLARAIAAVERWTPTGRTICAEVHAEIILTVLELLESGVDQHSVDLLINGIARAWSAQANQGGVKTPNKTGKAN